MTVHPARLEAQPLGGDDLLRRVADMENVLRRDGVVAHERPEEAILGVALVYLQTLRGEAHVEGVLAHMWAEHAVVRVTGQTEAIVRSDVVQTRYGIRKPGTAGMMPDEDARDKTAEFIRKHARKQVKQTTAA